MSSLNAIKPACVRETDHLVKTKNHTRLRVSDIRYHLIQTDHPRQTKVCSAASTNVNHHVPKEWLDKSMMDGSCSLDYHRLMSSLSRKELWVRKIDGKIDRRESSRVSLSKSNVIIDSLFEWHVTIELVWS